MTWLIFHFWHLDHVSCAFISLHWLWVPDDIEYKIAVLAYNALHGTALSYLGKLTRVSDTLGSQAFPVATPKILNSLPDNVVSATFLSTHYGVIWNHYLLLQESHAVAGFPTMSHVTLNFRFWAFLTVKTIRCFIWVLCTIFNKQTWHHLGNNSKPGLHSTLRDEHLIHYYSIH